MLGVGEHRVFLFGNPHARELARQVGEVGDLDAGDVIEIAGIVAVAADAIGDLADPRRDVVDGLVKLVPRFGMPAPLFSWVQRSAMPETSNGLEVSKRGGLRLSSRVESMTMGS